MAAKKKKLTKAAKKRRRKILFIIEFIVLLLCVAAFFVYRYIDAKMNKLQTDTIQTGDVTINKEAEENTALKGYTNIALFGVDSVEGDFEDARSDTNIIASINNDTKEVRLVSVYRDTYLDTGNGKYTKCNAAYAQGGPKKAISMLNTNLDLDITDYVAVNFEALSEIVDSLGGLEITLTEAETVHLNSYCQTMSKKMNRTYEKLPKKDGTYELTGIQVTAFARIRATAGSDFKRTERQREVITKIVEKVKKASLSTINDIMDKVFPMIATSLTKNEILKMGTQMLSYNLGEQTGFPFDHTEGEKVKEKMNLDCVVPVTLENNVLQLHQFLFSDEKYTASKTVKDKSNYIIKKSGYGEQSIPKKTTE